MVGETGFEQIVTMNPNQAKSFRSLRIVLESSLLELVESLPFRPRQSPSFLPRRVAGVGQNLHRRYCGEVTWWGPRSDTCLPGATHAPTPVISITTSLGINSRTSIVVCTGVL